MSKRRDYIAVFTMVLLAISSITGIFAMNFTHSFDLVNQYGETIKMHGYGIYARDTYLQAATSIGTDLCILLVVVPMFLYFYIGYIKKGDKLSELKLISMYALASYYAASIAFGLAYNQLFLLYIVLVTSSLFGMFRHIINLKWDIVSSNNKGAKVFLLLMGIALFVAWLPDVIASLISGGPLSILGVYTTAITYVLDMGIISPLCLLSIYLLNKKNPLGTMLLAIMLMMCLVVGIMLVFQTACQMLAKCEIPIGALITKSFSFVVLGGIAYYFYRKLYKELEEKIK